MFLSTRFTGVAQQHPDLKESPVENMIKIGQIIIADLRKGLETLQALFTEYVIQFLYCLTFLILRHSRKFLAGME